MKRTFKFFEILILMCGVFGADEDDVKSVSVMEGDSVTLNPDLTQIQGFIQMLWRFGDPLLTIARIDEDGISFSDDKRFEGRLQLDQTGSLTIKNMRIKHSGLYKLKIDHSTGTSDQKFSVTVYESPSVIDAGEAERQLMSVMEGDSVTLHVPQIQGNELIVWRSGDEGKLIAKHDIEAKSSSLYDSDERFRDRLQLDQTGSLIITNTRTTDSGLYTVKISSRKQTLYKRFTVTVSVSGVSPGVVAGIVFAVLLVSAAAAVIYYRHRMSELKKQTTETVKSMEGDFAFLSSTVTEIQESDQMLWAREDVKSPIATMSKKDKKTYFYDDKQFRGRLQLDPQNGSLIIRNLRKSDSGLYQLQIKSKGETSYRKCLVTLCGQVTTVHVKEGEDVTLEFDNFTLQRVSRVQWFRDEWCIASLTTENKQISTSDGPGGRFKDRLQLDTQTGFLTIKNIRPEHTGVYYVRSNHSAYGTKTFSIMSDDSTETWSNESETAGLMGRILRCPGLARKMCVFREQTDEKETDEKEKDEMKTVSIKEGDSLKLNTDTQIQMDDEILLMFGTSFATKHPYDIITRINKQINKQDKDEFKSAEKIFKDLKLDHSGSLTITINDTKAVHCGDYYVQITNKKNKSFKTFTFSVVPDGVFGESVNSVTKGGSVTLQAGVSEIQRYDQILWSYGPHGTIIANIKEEHPKCDFDMRFRDRLKLDETGSLTIKEAKTTDSGLYQLHVISSKKIRNKRFDVTVKDSSRNTEDDTIVSFDDLMSTNQNESDTLLNKRADGADDQEATSSL